MIQLDFKYDHLQQVACKEIYCSQFSDALHSTTAYKRDFGWTVVVHRMGFFQALGNEDRNAMLYASTQSISRVNHPINTCFYIEPFLNRGDIRGLGHELGHD